MKKPVTEPDPRPPAARSPALDRLHHVAIAVQDVAAAVDWYRSTFQCEVTYQDATWAMLRFANIELALVIPSQHPPHLGFTHPHAEKFGTLVVHRDGSRSVYVRDPAGNAVEILDVNSLGAKPGRS